MELRRNPELVRQFVDTGILLQVTVKAKKRFEEIVMGRGSHGN